MNPVPRHSSRGQAMTEFIVLCAVLVPMLLLFPIVYKYIDLMQAGEQASRYVAFEGTVHALGTGQQKSPDQLATEIGRRFFSRAGTEVLTSEGVSNDSGERLPLWEDHRSQTLVSPQSAAGARVQVRDFDMMPAVVVGGDRVAHEEFNLPRNRQSVADISLVPNALSGLAPFDTVRPTIHRTTALLGDPWTAGGPDDARQRFDDLSVVLNPMGPIRFLLELTGNLSRLVADEPFRPDGFWGDAAWYEIPCDRIRGCTP